jgi:hypothetical protein
VLDGASRHSLYEIPVTGATTAFYMFGDRFIVAHKARALILWEATSPMPASLPGIDLHDGSAVCCSGVDGALCEFRLINNIPTRHVILQNPPLDCRPPGYQLQVQPCTAISDFPYCVQCQDGNICIFRGVRFLPSNGKGAPRIRDGHSYPLVFEKADANGDLLQSIKVRLPHACAAILYTMNLVLHCGHNPAPVGGRFGPHEGFRKSDSGKTQPLLYANVRWVISLILYFSPFC